MYTQFYNLLERPFELTPDPRYLYLSAHHREALAHLSYGVSERKGFIQLTGEVGTGKTTMLDALVCGLDASTRVARLAHTTIDQDDLVRTLAAGFGVDVAGRSKTELLSAVESLLAVWEREGRNAVFVVDEAQNLSLPVLEEIRLLSNLRANGRCGLQIVLAGQPEFREMLERPELRQLRQRIAIRYHLTPLSREETREYVAHRLRVAGVDTPVFETGALDAIYERSGGVPRVVNTLCDRALLVGYAQGRKRIARSLAMEAADAIEGLPSRPAETPQESRPVTPSRRRAIVPVMTIVAAVVAVVLYASHGAWRAAPSAGRDDEALAGQIVVPAETPTAPGSSADAVDAPAAREFAVAETTLAGEPTADAAEPTAGSLEGRPEPAGEAPSAEAAEEVRPSGPYVVVAASTRGEDAARAEADRLAEAGLTADVVRVELRERGVWYRVIVDEGFTSPSDARPLIERLAALGDGDAWVTRR